MSFVPQSNVKILHTPLDVNGQNQIRFSSAAAQSAYFSGLAVKSYDSFTYQRKDDIIYVSDHIDALWSGNYVMYQNSNFNSKWFYAYITKMEYIDDHCTAISIKTDVFQTWFLSCTLKDSFIVREMEKGEGQSGYQPGTNLVDEGLETGEYIMNAGFVTTELNDLSILALSSETTDTGRGTYYEYNGIPCGLYMSLFADPADLSTWITAMTAAKKAESIVSIFLVPTAMLNGGGTPDTNHGFDGTHVQITKSIGYKPTTLDNYTPRNKKLLTFPYSFLYVSNRSGQAAILRYEFFAENAMNVKMDGGPMPACEVKLSPALYKGMSVNYDESISLNGYPCIAWISDVFQTWLAQNAYNIPINIATGAVSAVTAGITGSAVGVVGGALAVGNELAAIKTHELIPDQAKGSTAGSANIGMGIQNFLIMQKSITAQYAARIDQFFDMFGYKQNKVKIPDITSRAHWNYIKTIDCNIAGNIPGPDMEELKSLFNTGMTVWGAGSEIGNYTLNNYEVV